MREFMHCKIPAGVDESYTPRSGIRPGFSTCKAADCTTHDCSGILCMDCILHSWNAAAASRFFNCYKQNKEGEKSMKNFNLTIQERIFESYLPHGSTAYCVTISFLNMNVAEAKEELKALLECAERTYLVANWTKFYDCGCTALIPFSTQDTAVEVRDALMDVCRAENSEVRRFLDLTGACDQGREYAEKFNSMYEVWESCVNDRRRDYLDFMLSHVRDDAKEFNVAGIPDQVLTWARIELHNCSQPQDFVMYHKLNPFKKRKEV